MQRCLAFAWFLGITSAVLQAGDGLSSPPTSLKLPRIFRSGRQSYFSPPQVSAKPTFELKTEVPADGNVVELQDLNAEDDSLIDDAARIEDVKKTSDIIRIQHSESFPEEQRENIFPQPPSSAKSLSSDAVPLDGALRDDGHTNEEDDLEQPIYGSYSSLGWIAGANDRLGMLELDFKPSSRVWYDPNQPPRSYLDLEYGAKWLNGPNITDLPPQLFNLLINVGQRFEWSDRVTIDAMISPGWYTDFSNKGVQAFRLPWHLVSYYKVDDDWHWVLGVTDLARDDIQYLPVIGMVLAPAGGDFRLDLVFPRPRIAWKISDGTPAGEWQTWKGWKYRNGKSDPKWLTLGGELGGGSYAISRSDREYDVVTYRDFRLVAGLESKGEDGRASRLEVGWIFDRSVAYRSGIGNYNPADSFMIRISTDY